MSHVPTSRGSCPDSSGGSGTLEDRRDLFNNRLLEKEADILLVWIAFMQPVQKSTRHTGTELQ